jgi:hypothetical protein
VKGEEEGMEENEVVEKQVIEGQEQEQETEQQTGEETQAPAEPAAPPEPTAKEKALEAELARIRRKNRELEAARQPAPVQEPAQTEAVPGLPAKPQLDQFEDYDEYVVALSEWGNEKAHLTREYKARQTEAQTSRQAVINTHLDRVDTAKVKYTDWDEVAAASDVRFNDDTFAAILESDQSADISYHLMKNEAEAARINALPPIQQIKEIARLEDKFKAAPPVKRITQAPTPLNTLEGDTGVNAQKDPNKMTDSEWITWERERVKKLGKRY